MSLPTEEIDAILSKTRVFFNQQANLYGENFFLSKAVVSKKHSIIPLNPFQTFAQRLSNCQKCELYLSRQNVIIGSGNQNAELLIIGAPPDSAEDTQGRPFVGEAGELLEKIMQAIHLTRDDYYITNVMKCHPHQNRAPKPEELSACQHHLWEQINLIKPKIILAMGKYAGQTLLNTNQDVAQMRGRFYNKRGIEIIVTYHPSALLKDTAWKRPTWEDIKLLRKKYDGLMKKRNT